MGAMDSAESVIRKIHHIPPTFYALKNVPRTIKLFIASMKKTSGDSTKRRSNIVLNKNVY